MGKSNGGISALAGLDTVLFGAEWGGVDAETLSVLVRSLLSP